jgi:hypothetical protein
MRHNILHGSALNTPGKSGAGKPGKSLPGGALLPETSFRSASQAESRLCSLLYMVRGVTPSNRAARV